MAFFFKPHPYHPMPFQITKSDFGPVRTTSTEPLTEYLLEHTETGEFISHSGNVSKVNWQSLESGASAEG